MPRDMIKKNTLTKYDRLLGAHLSTAGGLLKTLERAEELRCNCVQIFASNPRGWKGRSFSETQATEYRDAMSRSRVRELIIHAIYLVNLASPKQEVYEKSLGSLRNDLISAGRLGAKNLVLHPGSDLGQAGGEVRLIQALRELQPDIPGGCRILLEGMAGTAHSLGDLPTIGRIGSILGPKIGVCLDSAHLCASGYNLGEAQDFKRFDRDVKKHIGYARVGCIHLNDSKKPCGSHRDHHENLGQGFVGRQGLINLVKHKPLRHLPYIIETPGFNEQGPDARNMRELKKYAGAGV